MPTASQYTSAAADFTTRAMGLEYGARGLGGWVAQSRVGNDGPFLDPVDDSMGRAGMQISQAAGDLRRLAAVCTERATQVETYLTQLGVYHYRVSTLPEGAQRPVRPVWNQAWSYQ